MMFNKGKKVEVSLGKEEYRDVWFPATVHEETENDSFLIEYHSKGIEDGPVSVKVIVDVLHIRPSPPHLNNMNFGLFDKVDAFIDFGWRSGVITRVLADNRFNVFFKSRKNERELNHSEIRPQLEWKDGSWFSGSQVLTASDYEGLPRNISYNFDQPEQTVSLDCLAKREGSSEERTGGSVKSMEMPIEQSSPCNEKTSNAAITSSKKRTELTVPDIDDQQLRPCKKLKDANFIETPSFIPCQLNTVPMDTPGEETQFGFSSLMNDKKTTSLEQTVVSDMPCLGTGNFSRGKKARSKRRRRGQLDSYTSDPLRRKGGRPSKSLATITQDLAGDNGSPDPSTRKGRRIQVSTTRSTKSLGDKKHNAVASMKENFVEKDAKEIPVTSNSKCQVTDGKQAEEPNKNLLEEAVQNLKDQKPQLHDPAVEVIKEDNQLEAGGESIFRSRGRPRKLPLPVAKVSAAVNQRNVGDVPDKMVAKDCAKKEVALPMVVGLAVTNNNEKPLEIGKKSLIRSMVVKGSISSSMKPPHARKDKPQNGKVGQASTSTNKKYSSKRGRQITVNGNIESRIHDPLEVSAGKEDATGEKDGTCKEVETSVDQSPNNMSDDQPLSTWFDGRHSPKPMDGTGVSHASNVEQCTEANGSQENVVVQSLVNDVMGDIVPYNDQGLPFMKDSPVWKVIEAMESVQKLPQNPHFHSLVSCKESSREGIAIGCMVNFDSVIKKTSRLKLSDPKSVIEENLETLLELEAHGFDVNKPRNRLIGLLSIKNKVDEFENQKEEPRSLLAEVNHSNTALRETIADIDNQMRILQEKRAVAVSALEKNESLIKSVESTIQGFDDGVRNVEREFEALVAAPW